MPGDCIFNISWISQFNKEFRWLQEVKDDKYKAFCVVCNSKMDIKKGGKTVISRHQSSKKHQATYNALKNRHQLTLVDLGVKQGEKVVQVEQISENDENNELAVQKCDPISEPSCSSSNQNLKNYLERDNVTEAEIIWALSKVQSHSSDRSAANQSQYFPLMFPDSKIAEEFQMKKDKLAYCITYGLGPYFQNEMLQTVRKCDFYAVSFDESHNSVAQKGQMDLHVQYWDSVTNTVCTRYLTSVFLQKATALCLLEAYKGALNDLGLKLERVVQVECDGPNVNLKFLKDLDSLMKSRDNEDRSLIDVGTCSLHVVHGAYRTAHDKYGWKIDSYLRSTYKFFKDQPVRKGAFTQVTECRTFPKKFCDVRWLENSDVLDTAIKILPQIKKYCESLNNNPPESLYFKTIVQFLADPTLLAKLNFLYTVSIDFEKFLTRFQSNNPQLPFLYGGLQTLLCTIGARFIKKDVLDECKTGKALTTLNLSENKDNLKTAKNIDVGFGANMALQNLKDIDKLQFKMNCSLYLVTMFEKLVAKSPLKKNFVKGATCLSPDVALTSTRGPRVKLALEELITNNHIAPTEADSIQSTYLTLCNLPEVKEKLRSWISNKKKTRLDSFWYEIGELEESESKKELYLKFVKITLILFCGNASVERGFSVNNQVLVENLHEDSLIAQRLVYDKILSAGGEIKNIPITKNLIFDFRRASSRRKDAIKKRRTEEEEMERKKKQAVMHIKELKEQKKKMIEMNKEEIEKLEY